jgi:arsenate reductase
MPAPDNAILFLCVANSSRSQMAEALARALAGPAAEIHSAGSAPTRLHPLAVRAMREIGIDISAQRAKPMEDVPRDRIGTVITLCAEEVCPTFPGKVERLHWPLEDPASTAGSEDEVLEAFRRVRDQLRVKIERLFRVDPRSAAGD